MRWLSGWKKTFETLGDVSVANVDMPMMIAETERLIDEMRGSSEKLIDKDKDYQLALECYWSGQISEAQWQKHLTDKAFAEWLDSHK